MSEFKQVVSCPTAYKHMYVKSLCSRCLGALILLFWWQGVGEWSVHGLNPPPLSCSVLFGLYHDVIWASNRIAVTLNDQHLKVGMWDRWSWSCQTGGLWSPWFQSLVDKQHLCFISNQFLWETVDQYKFITAKSSPSFLTKGKRWMCSGYRLIVAHCSFCSLELLHGTNTRVKRWQFCSTSCYL